MVDEAALERLRNEASSFALDLSQTVRWAFGSSVPLFRARAEPGSGRFSVHQEPIQGLTLTIDKVARLQLKAAFMCIWDHVGAYLAVETSKISVVAIAAAQEPLFRYEYVRDPRGSQACAHLQFHAHRDVIVYLMAISGDGSKRGKNRRREMPAPGARIPQLSDLHFPLGGPRFRPCFEDVLTMLIDEFGVDSQPGAEEALASGRERWRLHQLAAAVRDGPETAARVLSELGYSIEPPPEGPRPNRPEKLRAF